MESENYGVFRKGGSIGEKRDDKPIKVFTSKEEAKEYAKRMRKLLSPGEKKYYRLGFFVKPFKEKELKN